MGFRINEHNRKASSIEEALEFIRYWTEHRVELPFPADGVVIKVNNLRYWIFGHHSSCSALRHCLQVSSREKETKLKDVVFQVGRTGIITPVLCLNQWFWTELL